MELIIKSIRQEVSFEEDGVVTNVLILQEAETGEQFLAMVSDETVTRLVDIKHGLAVQPPVPEMSEPEPLPWGPEKGIRLQETEWDGAPAAVFGGAAAEPEDVAYAPTLPPESLPVAKTVDQQLREKKTKKVDINAKYNGGPTVAKDDLGYPIVPGLRKVVAVRDGDEDGIGQA